MHLHPLPSDGRFYCGPSAIAAFTGLHPKREVRAAINAVRGRDENRGVVLMQPGEVAAAMAKLGFNTSMSYAPAGTTLRNYIESHPDFVGVLYVTGHFVAVSNGQCIDNHTRIPRPLNVFPGNRKRIKAVIAITKRSA